MALYKQAESMLRAVIANDAVASEAQGQPRTILANLSAKIQSLEELVERLPEVERFVVIFNVDQRVRVYKIDMRAGVKRASEKTVLAVGRLQLLETPTSASSESQMLQLAIIKVDRFQFPLTQFMPCLAIRRGYYVLPTSTQNVFYGLMLPSRVPEAYVKAFETLLSARCQLRHASTATNGTSSSAAEQAVAVFEPAKSLPVRALGSVSSGVSAGSARLAQGVGAQMRCRQSVVQIVPFSCNWYMVSERCCEQWRCYTQATYTRCSTCCCQSK
jgi:hypothetical protein